MNKYEKVISRIEDVLAKQGMTGDYDMVVTPVDPADETKLRVYTDGCEYGIFDTEKNAFTE